MKRCGNPACPLWIFQSVSAKLSRRANIFNVKLFSNRAASLILQAPRSLVRVYMPSAVSMYRVTSPRIPRMMKVQGASLMLRAMQFPRAQKHPPPPIPSFSLLILRIYRLPFGYIRYQETHFMPVILYEIISKVFIYGFFDQNYMHSQFSLTKEFSSLNAFFTYYTYLYFLNIKYLNN